MGQVDNNTPYCYIYGQRPEIKIPLIYDSEKDLIFIRDEFAAQNININSLINKYSQGRISVDELLDAYKKIGAKYKMVYSIFSVNGDNNSLIKKRDLKLFKLYV